jgi:hypothetical protein
MPNAEHHNHQHTCRCGAIWVVVRWGDGPLEWMFIEVEEER